MVQAQVGGPRVKLNNGLEIPLIGLGTWRSTSEEVVNAVEYAIKEVGYRHIDTAAGYGNEKEVGEGIRKSGVPRSEIFLTSKLWSTNHHRVEEALDESLAKLGTDYLDLYLVHWPFALNPNHPGSPGIPLRPDGTRDVLEDWKISATWKQMEAVYKKGKVKAIGVSNFSQPKIDELLETAEVVPAVDQLELHVYNPQHKLISYLKSKSILPQAYSPLGSDGAPLLKDPTAASIAQKYGLQTADVLFGYILAKDLVVLPKTVSLPRLAANYNGALAALEKLQKEDVETLDGLSAAGKQKRFITPPWGVTVGFDDWQVAAKK